MVPPTVESFRLAELEPGLLGLGDFVQEGVDFIVDKLVFDFEVGLVTFGLLAPTQGYGCVSCLLVVFFTLLVLFKD